MITQTPDLTITLSSPKSSYLDAGRTIWRGYTSDGLFINWMIYKPSNDFFSLDVNITQTYINGKKPKDLEGAVDDKITITIPKNTTLPLVGSFVPSCPQQIDETGRYYAGRAIDAIIENKLSLSYIENTIKNSTPEKYKGRLCYNGMGTIVSKKFTACTDLSGNVLTVTPYAFK